MNARSSVIRSAERGLSCIVGWLILVVFNGVYGLNRRRAWRKTTVMTGRRCHVTTSEGTTPWESCRRDFSKTCIHLTECAPEIQQHTPRLPPRRHGGTPAEEVQVHLLHRPDKKYNLGHWQQARPRMGD